MSLGKCCVSGSIHEGEPTGKFIELSGHRVYVATPEEGKGSKDKALLFLTDVFGVDLVNNKLLADSYAKNGIQVFAPDYLNGDPVPVEEMEAGTYDIMKWFPTHGAAQTRPALDKTIAYAKEQGFTSLAAVGYCFGARYTFDLAYEGKIKVGAVNHPSLIQPEDLEKLSKLDFPMLFNTCGEDPQMPKQKIELADKLMQGKETYKRNHWENSRHGFAVRSDFSKPENVKAHNEAFAACYEWIASRLQ